MFDLCARLGQSVSVLHVQDPYLKQFYNEIYAQGRKEYLEHVDSELLRLSDALRVRIENRCRELGISCRFVVRHGDPLDEIITEVRQGGYDLVVTGGKRLSGLRAFRSWNLPARLASRLGDVSLFIVRESGI